MGLVNSKLIYIYLCMTDKVITNDYLFRTDLFPDVNTPNRLFDGIPYRQLPVINIKACKNNTIMNLTDYKGAFVSTS